MEVIISLQRSKRFINRGFLIGPYCPIYGWGCTIVVLLLSKYQHDYLALFIMSMVICGLLEYITSFLMEKLFKVRWWDYSKKRFNINGRICLETLIPFGLIASVIVLYINPFIEKMLLLINSNVLNIIAIIVFMNFVLDSILSFNIMNDIKKTIKDKNRHIDRTEEISKRVKKILTERGLLYKRIINAFPNSRINKIKDRIRRK